MKIGEYEVRSLNTGYFKLDGGAMFGSVPKVLWEKTNPADEKNRIQMALRCLLIRSSNRCILVDCGIGTRWESKYTEMYAIDQSSENLEKALTDNGVQLSDITDVIITHLHFDHIGGATKFDEQGKIQLSFPNADIYIQEENLNQALRPTPKDRASFVLDLIAPLQERGRLKTLKAEQDLFPGISILIANGHTVGQQLVKVGDGKNTVVHCGDLIPTSSHIHIPYVMGYDLAPVITMQEKEKLLAQAVEEKWILVWEHDPFISAGTVKNEDGKYRLEKEVSL